MGMVTDIQRFSLNDGPGIRTTVFFKGCNVACAWCHNPETLRGVPELLVYPGKCIGCGACVDFDPVRAAEGLPPPREALALDRAEVCFSGALTVAGREMTVEEVMREVTQDIPYYETSGGGLTLSGGEVMMQPAFAADILRACRMQGIATAIETNLLYDFGLLERLLPWIDLVMADLKLHDCRLHETYVGVGNEQALENVRRLAASGAPYILRTPIIPGLNDTKEAIARMAGEARGNLLYYELLNFNPLGASKYRGLDRQNLFEDKRPLQDEAMERLKVAAERTGIPVRVG